MQEEKSTENYIVAIYVFRVIIVNKCKAYMMTARACNYRKYMLKIIIGSGNENEEEWFTEI